MTPEPTRRTPPLRRMHIRSLAPNVLTMLALCAGLTAIRFALSERWELAVYAIVLAGVFDGLDGTVARLLKSTSRFGAELDSLSDVVAFGIAPALILYLWSLNGITGLGWIITLAFALTCALRLARYNARLDDEDEPRRLSGFLTGVPAPVGAGLALVPMMLEFQFGTDLLRTTPLAIALYTACVGFLMISTFATYSWKGLVVRREVLVPVMLFVGLFATLLTIYPWAVMLLCAAAYLVSIPMAMSRYRRRRLQRHGDGEAV